MQNKEIEHDLITRFRKRIWSPFAKAVRDYELIQENDKIAVCISGGKDSFLMAKCMQEIQKHGKVKFDLVFLTMDPGYKEENYQLILENAKKLEIPLEVFQTNIFASVTQVKDSPCYLCARMRRGHLYHRAKDLGCNKIALGHHFNDVIETILMSTLYGGEFRTMMPKLHSENFEGMELIRPMYLVHEEDIISWQKAYDLKFLNCACHFTEAVDKNQIESKRAEIKQLIKDLKKKSSYIEMNIFRSVENVNLDTLISYHKKGKYHHFLEDYDQNDGE